MRRRSRPRAAPWVSSTVARRGRRSRPTSRRASRAIGTTSRSAARVARRERDEHLVVAEVVEHEPGRVEHGLEVVVEHDREVVAAVAQAGGGLGRAPCRRARARRPGARRGTRRPRAGRARRRRSGTRRGAAGRRGGEVVVELARGAVELLAQERGVAGEHLAGRRRAHAARRRARSSGVPGLALQRGDRLRDGGLACSRARLAAAVIEPSRATASRIEQAARVERAQAELIGAAGDCFVGAQAAPRWHRGGHDHPAHAPRLPRPRRRGRQPARRLPRRRARSRPPTARPSPPTSASPRPCSSTTRVTGELRIFTPAVELPLAGPSARRHRVAARRRHAAPARRRGPDVVRRASSPGSAPGRSGRRSTTSRSSPRRSRTSTPSRSPAATRWSASGPGRTRPRAACARGSSPTASGSTRTRRPAPRRSSSARCSAATS